MFFKVVAGVLSTLALATGIAMAIPESREFILNTVAPYSQVYEEQKDKTNELESAYNLNLETLNRTREALANAESQSLTYQTNLSTARSELLSAQNELSEKTTILSDTQTSYDDAVQRIANLQNDIDNLNWYNNQLNIDLINLNQEYQFLQEQYNQALMNGNQTIIDDLNRQIGDLIMERDNLYFMIEDRDMQINDLYMQLDMERIDRDYYEMRMMDMQYEIDMLNNDIMMINDECMRLQMEYDRVEQERMNLQMQYDKQQETINQLNQEIESLNNVRQDLENGSIVFDRSVVTLLCPIYDDNHVLTGMLNMEDNPLTNCDGYLLKEAYIRYCIDNEIMANTRVSENDAQIRVNTYDSYHVMIGLTTTSVHVKYYDYFFAPNTFMNVIYEFNGTEMTSNDLLNNIDESSNYTFMKEYNFTLDENSQVSSITCNFRVMDQI